MRDISKDSFCRLLSMEIIYSSAKDDMISMDSSLQKLCKNGTISRDTALAYASNPEMLAKKI